MTCATKLAKPRYDCKQRCIRYIECFSKPAKAEAKPVKAYEYRNMLDETAEELRADIRSMAGGF